MTNGLQPYKMLPRTSAFKSISISGAKTNDLSHHIIPSIQRSPDSIIIHGGSNDLREQNAERISSNIINLANTVSSQSPNTKVFISSIIHRQDNTHLNQEIYKANNLLKDLCTKKEIIFIDNDNITFSDLNNSGLHLNKPGTSKLAKNIIDSVKTAFPTTFQPNV